MDNQIGLADVLAVMNSKDSGSMAGGSWMWVIFLFFIFAIFFSGGGLFGGNCANQADLQNQFNFAALERQNNETIAAVRQSQYDTAGEIKDSAFNNLGYIRDVQAMVMQNGHTLENCCCQQLRAIDGVNYNGVQNTNTITNAIHAEGEATRALINQNTMQELRDRLDDKDRELLASNFALSQQSQNAVLISALRPFPQPAYITCSPYQAANGCGVGCGY